MPNKLKMCITNMIVETKVKVKYTSNLFRDFLHCNGSIHIRHTGRLSAYGVLLKTKYWVRQYIFKLRIKCHDEYYLNSDL